MEKKGRRILAAALLPGVLTLSGCENVLAGLSAGEKCIVLYCIAAIVALLWLLGKVKSGARKRPARAATPQWQTPQRPAPQPTAVQPAAPQQQAPQPAPVQAPGREQAPAYGNPWWDIPSGTYIFIDTCVPMEATHDRVVAAWFDHLRQHAKERNWTIVILNSVIRELDGLKNSSDEERAQASRAATNLLGEMQRSLGSRFTITGANCTPADDEFEREMQQGDLLCTRDNNLALRINGVPGLRALGLMDFPRFQHMRPRR